MSKKYKLIGSDGEVYYSAEKGTLGGHKGEKIYGRLDCPSALSHISKGEYISQRVFFKDEVTALAAGYRPCGVCMKSHYQLWKEGRLMTHALSASVIFDEDIATSVEIQIADGSKKYLSMDVVKDLGIWGQLNDGMIEYWRARILGDYCILLLTCAQLQGCFTIIWNYVRDEIVHVTNTAFAVDSVIWRDYVISMYYVSFYGHPADMQYSVAPFDLIDPQYEPDPKLLDLPVNNEVANDLDNCWITIEDDSVIFHAGENKQAIKLEDLPVENI